MSGWVKASGLYGLQDYFRGQLVKEIIHLQVHSINSIFTGQGAQE